MNENPVQSKRRSSRFRSALLLVGILIGLFFCIEGLVVVRLFAIPATDIDGPVSFSSRVGFAAFGLALANVGLLGSLWCGVRLAGRERDR